MAFIPGFRRLLRLEHGRSRVDGDVDTELLFHVEMRAAELVASGMPERQARDVAMRDFGNWERYRDDCRTIGKQWERTMQFSELVESIWSDVRYGWRSLRRAPGFAAVAVVTLALGIGATTSIFSVVSGVLLTPLPYDHPDRIVHLGEMQKGKRGRGTTSSEPNYEDWRRLARSFEAMGMYDGWSPTIVMGEPERIKASLVTSGVFDVFRLTPVLGRAIQPSDNVANAAPVVVLTHGFWQRRMGGDPNVIGKLVRFQATTMPIVGVLPPGFIGPNELDGEIWSNYTPGNDGRGGRSKDVVARLRPSVTLEQARAEMTGIAAQLERQYPKENTDATVSVDPIADLFVGDVRGMLTLLLGAAGLVLLIACANLSNLLIARGISRRRELAIRTALGAGRRRAVRQLLTESVLLAAIGGSAGIVAARWTTQALVTRGPQAIRDAQVSLDLRVLAFSVGVTLGAGMLFGILPALRATRVDLQSTLKDGSRGSGDGGTRTRGVLAVAQFALALTLLAGSALLVKSFIRVQRIDPGVRPDHLLTFSMNLPGAKYPDQRQWVSVYNQLERELRAVPGVRDVAVASLMPMHGSFDRIGVRVEGDPEKTGADMPEGDRYIVNPGYFSTMGIPLHRGRLFTRTDGYETPLVTVVDDVFARRTFGSRDPIGRRMKLPGRDSLATIVGIVGHVKTYGLDVASGGQIYMSTEQYAWRWMSLAVRTQSEPLALAPTVRQLVRGMDATQPIFDVGTMEQHMRLLTAGRRFALELVGVFAGVALLLSAVGLYGLVAYSVSQRRQEIGIRVALGAQVRDVIGLVLRQGVALAIVGVAIGTMLALAGGQLLAGMLFDVTPRDPTVLALVSVVLVLVALVASYIPARRAGRIDAAEVLRQG